MKNNRTFVLLLAGVVLLVGCGRSDSQKDSDQNLTGATQVTQTTQTTEVSAEELYAERVRTLTGEMGIAESKLLADAAVCGVDLRDLSIPFSEIQDIMFPYLGGEVFLQSLRDLSSGIDKPRCLYAQGG